MSEWKEECNNQGLAIYRRTTEYMGYISVVFNKAHRRITIEEYDKTRRNLYNDMFYTISPPSLTAEDIAFINDKSKELFKECD